MNLSEIARLAEQSKTMTCTGDAYADQRCKWVTDKANVGKAMYWDADQPYYRFLYLISKNFPGVMGIEVGTHHGIGFSCMAAGATANGNLKSWTVGIDKDNHNSAIEVSTKYPRTKFINGLSNAPTTVAEVEKICRDEGISVGIIFLDATHKICWTHTELMTFRYLFGGQVIIIMDDVINAANNTDLPKAFDEIPGEKIKFPNLHTDNCIAVSLSSFDQFKNWVPPTKPWDLGY